MSLRSHSFQDKLDSNENGIPFVIAAPSDVLPMLTYYVVQHVATVCDDHDIPPTIYNICAQCLQLVKKLLNLN